MPKFGNNKSWHQKITRFKRKIIDNFLLKYLPGKQGESFSMEIERLDLKAEDLWVRPLTLMLNCFISLWTQTIYTFWWLPCLGSLYINKYMHFFFLTYVKIFWYRMSYVYFKMIGNKSFTSIQKILWLPLLRFRFFLDGIDKVVGKVVRDTKICVHWRKFRV